MDTPKTDMDANRLIKSWNGIPINKKRTFMHGLIEVDELVLEIEPGVFSLVWAWHPIEEVVVKGKARPLVHMKFTKKKDEEQTRAAVQCQFNKQVAK
jgi:hypothetical protein